MTKAAKRKFLRTSRMTTLYIVIATVVFAIVFPMYFLVMISFMSDYEAYDWPLPLVPSFKIELMIEQSDEGYHLNIYNRRSEMYERFGPVSFARTEDDMFAVSRFLRRQANTIVDVEEIDAILLDVGPSNPAKFTARKNLLLNYIVFFDVT